MDQDSDDRVLGPLKALVSPERYAELEAAIGQFALAPEDPTPDDELAELGFLDLLTAEEEDVVVAGMVHDIVDELRTAPVEPALLEATITLLENGYRCRIPAQATVVTMISDTPLEIPFEGAADMTAGLISVGVVVDDGARGVITTPYDTAAQRTLLSTVGSRIAVRVSIRDRHRIALDLDAFTATD